jgi:predicted TIM-barrel fold metal-dependent hydrolase
MLRIAQRGVDRFNEQLTSAHSRVSTMLKPLTRRHFLGAAAVGASATATGDRPVGAAGRSTRSKVVDSHVHLKHGDAARTEFTARTIVDVMDKAGIDQSVVFAMCTTTKRSIAMAEAAVAEFPDRLIPYAYALPSYERPVLKELEAALTARVFRGIKIHAGECVLTDYVIDPVLKLAARFQVPCLIDAAGNVAAARRIALSFPDTAVIFAHMGRYGTTDGKLVDAFIKLAGEHERVFLDLSGVALEAKMGEAAAKIGAAKLIWGTDGPYAHPDLVTYARTELEKVRRLALGQTEIDAILGGNLLKLIAKTEESHAR